MKNECGEAHRVAMAHCPTISQGRWQHRTFVDDRDRDSAGDLCVCRKRDGLTAQDGARSFLLAPQKMPLGCALDRGLE